MFLPGLNEAFTPEGFRRVIQALRTLALGGTNAAGAFALTPGANETVVPAPECGEASLPILTPWSAEAAASGWWVKSVERGHFTVAHAMAPQGAAFRYELRQP